MELRSRPNESKNYIKIFLKGSTPESKYSYKGYKNMFETVK